MLFGKQFAEARLQVFAAFCGGDLVYMIRGAVMDDNIAFSCVFWQLRAGQFNARVIAEAFAHGDVFYDAVDDICHSVTPVT